MGVTGGGRDILPYMEKFKRNIEDFNISVPGLLYVGEWWVLRGSGSCNFSCLDFAPFQKALTLKRLCTVDWWLPAQLNPSESV
jgi:hypothetical protein